MGQPGVGFQFLRWLWQNVANPDVCREVAIRQISWDPEDYDEMPKDTSLATFDPSDRKFVAVAMAYDGHAVIVNAVDSDWRIAEHSLITNGLHLKFLCPQHA